jgi:hypothetical protein
LDSSDRALTTAAKPGSAEEIKLGGASLRPEVQGRSPGVIDARRAVRTFEN